MSIDLIVHFEVQMHKLFFFVLNMYLLLIISTEFAIALETYLSAFFNFCFVY